MLRCQHSGGPRLLERPSFVSMATRRDLFRSAAAAGAAAMISWLGPSSAIRKTGSLLPPAMTPGAFSYLSPAEIALVDAAVSRLITPDKETGIGNWTDDEFYKAMHDGIGPGGTGIADVFPPLKGSAAVQAKDPATVLEAMIDGATVVATAEKPTGLAMPAFGWKLSDAQIAAVTTYVRNAWGNAAPPVSPGDVESMRKSGGS